MRKPYTKPVSTVLPDRKIPEPHISPLVRFFCHVLGRVYLFAFLGIRKIDMCNGKPFFEAFSRALAGESRCIIAFRHPNGGEPQILMYYILFMLRSQARRAGVRFCRVPNVSFVYGYEVARWGGAIARWVMPGLGAMPVHHSKVDSAGMTRIFKAVTEGLYPLAIAPEGQVSYTTESIPRLEQGAVRIGFHAAERLKRQGKNCPVEILPLSIHLRYGRVGRRSLEKLLVKIEKYTGFRQDGTVFSERLRRVRDYILEKNEKRYGITAGTDQGFAERVDALMEAALGKAEQILGIQTRRGDLMGRMYYIRQVCWDRQVIPGVMDLRHLTLLEKSMLDLSAGEAWHASRHMELVDFVWYFRVPVPVENAPLHNIVEYTQNLWDFANRSMGGAYPNRAAHMCPAKWLIMAGSPINMSERLVEYAENKNSAVDKTMRDMEQEFLACIDRAASLAH